MEIRDNIYVPFGVSVLIHSLFLFFMISTAGRVPLPTGDPIEVEIREPQQAMPARPPPSAAAPPAPAAPPAQAVPPPEVAKPKNQIVSPPDSPEAEPENPRYLSDRNSRAEEEMVKRGQPAPPAEPPKMAKREKGPEKKAPGQRGDPNRARNQPAERRSAQRDDRPPAPALPGLADLFARPSEVLSDPAIAGGFGGDADSGEDTGARDLAKHSRPDIWAEPGERGTLDYLPEIRQGKFTLLNTKADLFAPFVRRVGMRIFQTFSMDFKRRIFGGDVPQGKEQLEIEAVMSRDGRRLQVWLKKRDGNLSADRTLLATLNESIFFDENPPSGAVAADGHIHFVFALDASVWFQPSENGMQPGAQWVFGAGLL